MMRIKLAIIGDGKMGRAVAALAPDAGFDIVARLGAADVAAAGVTAALLNGATIAIEFTEPAAAATNVRQCLAAGCAVVCGTTGWDAERLRIEEELRGGAGALLWAPNFALGVHVFARIAEYATRLVAQAGAGFDIHLSETHHKAKLDAPSGTARLLADRATPAWGSDIPVTSIRTGTVPGTHAFTFDAPFEQITLEHVARDRRVFAAGALHAARWLVGRRGVFTLDHLFPTPE
jgi:4-hydroxy-tetrahydrodipicolinate reductase